MLSTRKLRLIVAFTLGVALLMGVINARLVAQGTSGTILGTVTDSSGAVMPDAKVQVTNTGTRAVQTAVSDAQGRYRVQALPVGEYEAQAENAGFQTVVRKAITLNAGANVIVDFQLTVGQVTQTVVVEAAVSQVETTSAALSTLVEPLQMRELPLNGRNFEELIQLAPGVSVQLNATKNTFMGTGDYWSVSGSRANGQGELLDGTNIQNYQDRGAGSGILGTSLGVDAISEFQMLTNTYGAQYGGNGSVVNAVTRSGTNTLHGSLYEFARDSALDARRYFDAEKKPFRKNQYGGTLGGPIKRDKMFFFVNYEGIRQHTGTSTIVTVPNALTHIGVIPSATALSACSLTNAYAVPAGAAAGTAMYNCGPGSPNAAKFAIIKPYMDLFPIGDQSLQATVSPGVSAYGDVSIGSTLTDLGNGTAQTTVSGNSPGYEKFLVGRYDWTMSAKDSLFVRYLIDDGELTDFAATSFPQYPSYNASRNQYVTIGQKHIFSDRLVNSATAAYTRTFFLIYPVGNTTSDLLNFEGDLFGHIGLPPMDGSLSIGSGTTGIGPASAQPIRYAQNKISFTEDLLWIKGSHSLRIGGSVARIQTNGLHSVFSGGSWSFSNLANFLQNIPLRFQGPCNYYNMAHPMPGCTFPDGTPFAFPESLHDTRETQFAVYLQDDWRLRPTLTLNIGLRYAPATNPWDKLNQIYQLLPVPFGQTGVLPPALPSPAPALFSPTRTFSLRNTSLHNIDPRIGLAWDPFPDHKTSVRAGYGIFHTVVQARDYSYGAFLGYPWSNMTLTSGVNTFPLIFQTRPTAATSVQYGWNPYNTTPYLQQWNLSVQREVMRNTILTVSYVGSHGVHLFAQEDMNPPLPSGVPGGISLANTRTLWPNYPGQAFVCTAGSCTFSGAGNANVTCTSAAGCTLAAANGQAFVNPATGQKTYAHIEQTGATSFSIQPNTRVNPNFAYINGGTSNTYSHYNALQAGLVRRMTNNLSAQVSYTYSQCIDIASGSFGFDSGNPGPAPWDIYSDRGPCAFMLRHNLTTNALYMLPFKGNRLVSGWQVGGILYFRTGGPTNPTSFAQGPDIGQVSNTQRPDYVPNAPGCSNKPVKDEPVTANGVFYYNPACFAVSALGERGSLGRNAIFGPHSTVLNATIQKNTAITERFNLQLRAEFFNALNHANFSLPSASFTQGATTSAATVVTGTPNATFGQIISTSGEPRQIQFGVKLLF